MSTNFEYREREKVRDRTAKLNEKKSDRQLERKKRQKRHFLLERQHENSGGEKIRNASGHQDENKRQ